MWFSSKDRQGEAIQEDSEIPPRSGNSISCHKPTGRMCLGDGTDLGHAPAAFGMGAKMGLQGTLRELRAVRGLLPHSKSFKIPFHWEGRCSHKGYSLVIHRQGFCSQQLCFCPGSLLAASSAFFHSGRGAARSSVLPPPGPGLGGTGTQSHPRIARIHNSQA